MSESFTKTGGTFSRHGSPVMDADDGSDGQEDRPILFAAHSKVAALLYVKHTKYMLVAITELGGDKHIVDLVELMDRKHEILIDSGIFTLTNNHMRNHGCTMDEALALPPDRIDGFNELFDRYLEILGQLGDRSWGYIEMDQGGRDNKIRTREKLESYGLNPIPVYHPINDGWDYFDYLASRYDRICIGNIVQAKPELRTRIMATVCERRIDYPDLWMHGLGVGLTATLFPMPFDSADATSWLNPVRWTDFGVRSCMVPCGILPRDYVYDRNQVGDHPKGWNGMIKVLGWDVSCCNIMWRDHRNSIRREINSCR